MATATGMGTVLKIATKTVGRLKSINGVSLSADTVDMTTLDSADGYKEFAQGLRDAGEISVSGLMDGADEGQAQVLTQFDADTAAACSIIFPATIGKTWSFNALVTKFSTGAEMTDGVSFEATLKLTGKPTLAATGG